MYTDIGTPIFLTNPLWVYQSSEVYTKKPIMRRRTLVNDSKLLKIEEIDPKWYCNRVLEAFSNCQILYGFTSQNP